ncbi:hypothetical protein HPULCUR_002289 [Helicostylum pulchrum]|uniref:Transmembrane protein n=1 Tax=Helicostylum pulchrum TaxID=562976 RepID=A0ABP9XQ40_9FUNG
MKLSDEESYKAARISAECIMFIAFEVWKLWFTFDEMYVTVQWFLLALKIDAYFEFGAYALYVSYLEANDLYNYYTSYRLAFIIAAVWTIALAIMCLLNFNKGLKEFVQWKPFSRKLLRGQSAIYNMNQADTFHGLEDQRADEPIDDE